MPNRFQDVIKTKLADEKKLFVLNLIFTSGWIDQIYEPIFKENGITKSQYNILRILNGSSPKPLSVGEIKERILFKQTDITRMIDRLVDKSFVDRKLCPENRRKMDVSISEGGIHLLANIAPLIEKVDYDLFKRISKEDAKIGNEILDKLRG